MSRPRLGLARRLHGGIVKKNNGIYDRWEGGTKVRMNNYFNADQTTLVAVSVTIQKQYKISLMKYRDHQASP